VACAAAAVSHARIGLVAKAWCVQCALALAVLASLALSFASYCWTEKPFLGKPTHVLINSLDRNATFGTRMCQPKSIAQVIDFEGKQERCPQHLATCFPSLIKSQDGLISGSL
jgi:hypothetical protein